MNAGDSLCLVVMHKDLVWLFVPGDGVCNDCVPVSGGISLSLVVMCAEVIVPQLFVPV